MWKVQSVCQNPPIFAGVCLYFLKMDKSLPHSDWESPRSDQVPVKENHPLIQNTCVYWVTQWACLCSWGGTVKSYTWPSAPEFRKKKSINKTLKLQLEKLYQETHLQWDQLLPIALLRIKSGLTKWTGLSPFEIIFGCPSLLLKGLQEIKNKKKGDPTLKQQMQTLRLTLKNQWLGRRETPH
jgi:hypothetical protein